MQAIKSLYETHKKRLEAFGNICFFVICSFNVGHAMYSVHSVLTTQDPVRVVLIASPNEREQLVGKFIEEFKQEAKARSQDVDLSRITYSVEKIVTTEKAWGTCDTETKHMTFSPKLFETNAGLVRHVVFHELGHCALDLEHEEDTYGIMNVGSSEYRGSAESLSGWPIMVENLFIQSLRQQEPYVVYDYTNFTPKVVRTNKPISRTLDEEFFTKKVRLYFW